MYLLFYILLKTAICIMKLAFYGMWHKLKLIKLEMSTYLEIVQSMLIICILRISTGQSSWEWSLGHVFCEIKILIFLTSFSCCIFLGIFTLKLQSLLHDCCLKELPCRLLTAWENSPHPLSTITWDLTYLPATAERLKPCVPSSSLYSVCVMGEGFSWGQVQSFLEVLVPVPFP